MAFANDADEAKDTSEQEVQKKPAVKDMEQKDQVQAPATQLLPPPQENVQSRLLPPPQEGASIEGDTNNGAPSPEAVGEVEQNEPLETNENSEDIVPEEPATKEIVQETSSDDSSVADADGDGGKKGTEEDDSSDSNGGPGDPGDPKGPDGPSEEDLRRQAEEQARAVRREKVRGQVFNAAVSVAANIPGIAMDAANNILGSVRRLTNAFLDNGPLSASSRVVAETLADTSGIENRLNDIREMYGIMESTDPKVVDSTVKGRMMNARTKEEMEGIAYAQLKIDGMLKNLSDDPTQLDPAAVQKIGMGMRDEVGRIKGELQSGVDPSTGKPLTPSQKRTRVAQVRQYAEAMKGLQKRTEEARRNAVADYSDARHQETLNRRAEAQRVRDAKAQEKARAEQDAQARYDSGTPEQKVVWDILGRDKPLDENGVVTTGTGMDRVVREAALKLRSMAPDDPQRQVWQNVLDRYNDTRNYLNMERTNARNSAAMRPDGTYSGRNTQQKAVDDADNWLNEYYRSRGLEPGTITPEIVQDPEFVKWYNQKRINQNAMDYNAVAKRLYDQMTARGLTKRQIDIMLSDLKAAQIEEAQRRSEGKFVPGETPFMDKIRRYNMILNPRNAKLKADLEQRRDYGIRMLDQWDREGRTLDDPEYAKMQSEVERMNNWLDELNGWPVDLEDADGYNERMNYIREAFRRNGYRPRRKEKEEKALNPIAPPGGDAPPETVETEAGKGAEVGTDEVQEVPNVRRRKVAKPEPVPEPEPIPHTPMDMTQGAAAYGPDDLGGTGMQGVGRTAYTSKERRSAEEEADGQGIASMQDVGADVYGKETPDSTAEVVPEKEEPFNSQSRENRNREELRNRMVQWDEPQARREAATTIRSLDHFLKNGFMQLAKGMGEQLEIMAGYSGKKWSLTDEQMERIKDYSDDPAEYMKKYGILPQEAGRKPVPPAEPEPAAEPGTDGGEEGEAPVPPKPVEERIKTGDRTMDRASNSLKSGLDRILAGVDHTEGLKGDLMKAIADPDSTLKDGISIIEDHIRNKGLNLGERTNDAIAKYASVWRDRQAETGEPAKDGKAFMEKYALSEPDFKSLFKTMDDKFKGKKTLDEVGKNLISPYFKEAFNLWRQSRSKEAKNEQRRKEQENASEGIRRTLENPSLTNPGIQRFYHEVLDKDIGDGPDKSIKDVLDMGPLRAGEKNDSPRKAFMQQFVKELNGVDPGKATIAQLRDALAKTIEATYNAKVSRSSTGSLKKTKFNKVLQAFMDSRPKPEEAVVPDKEAAAEGDADAFDMDWE